MGLPEFWEQMCHSPMLMVSTVLTLGVILVNGWTDAPNAIATCVSTRAISARKAIVMAAVFNFLGVLVMTAVNASVAMTIYNMVDFGGNAHISLVALCAAMAAIVIWATAAWYFGIPTSESHALIAGISGAAVAIQNSFSGINGAEWMKDTVVYGIGLCLWLCCIKTNAPLRSALQQDPSKSILFRSTSCRRRSHGIYARCTGRTKIHGDLSPRRSFFRRTFRYIEFYGSGVVDDTLFCRYGSRDLYRWLSDH